jgi:hypothetical protein
MQAGPRWRPDVFLFLKWVWLGRLDHRVDSGDTPPPVRVLRSLDRVFSRCKTAGALAAKPLTGCKSRLGHPRFSRKTGRAAPLPFLITRPISARRQAPASAWGHPNCPSRPASAILPVLARWLRRRMRQASSRPAPSWFHPVGAGERPNCRTASASVAMRTPRQRSRASPCSPTRPNASS